MWAVSRRGQRAMRILYEPRTKELDIEGSGKDLSDLAVFLRDAAAILYDNVSVARHANEAYSKCLSRIVVDRVEGQNVRLTVQGDECLVITGDAPGLAYLTANIASAAQMPVGEHTHIDFYPGHVWLAEDSCPLVVSKISE
jgi:hypothetical protein